MTARAATVATLSDSMFDYEGVVPSSPDDSEILLQRIKARTPQPVLVAGISREIYVKIASERKEWEEAFRLVTANYQAAGYEPLNANTIRFTRHHALPDTRVFVAKVEGRVVFTFTLVPDNSVLGLPMESIYSDEIQELRQSGRRLAETICLAEDGLSQREFLNAFMTMIRVMKQYHVRQGGDSWVMSCNPRHRNFYTKKLGYQPFGALRSYDAVQGAPAEAYLLDQDIMQANAPKGYQEIFGEDLPPQVLTGPAMPRHLVQYFASRSSQTEIQTVREIFSYQDSFGSPQLWQGAGELLAI